MESTGEQPNSICHIVALPYPGQGHINAMMNLCNLLVSLKSDILITFVITEEWLDIIGSDGEAKMDNIRFATIPNVIPSEKGRAENMDAFFEAIMTKMESPFEKLVDELDSPPTVIVADTFVNWALLLGNRRNIRTASFWPMSATQFTTLQHFHLFVKNGDFPINLSEKENERVDYIPGVSSTRLADFVMDGSHPQILGHILNNFSWVPKADFLLVSSVYELERQVIDVLRSELSLPIYTIGPLIPSFKAISPTGANHLQWLDSQPCSSVLYISMGSFLSFSRVQMDEIATGLRKSGVRFFWVARGETNRLQQICGEMGFVVPWCDQMRVLSHSSVGGFWSHCGWNSVREGAFSGVPFLTFPIGFDQGMNSKVIVEDWKTGWRVKSTEAKTNYLVTSEEIAMLVKTFMDLEHDEGKELRKRASELQQIWKGAIAEGGSTKANINAFFGDISEGIKHK